MRTVATSSGTSGSGSEPAGVETVSAQPRPLEQAIEEASVGVKTLSGPPPSASAPTEGLPANAQPGEAYTFQSEPDAIYLLGCDFVWRALLLVRAQ